MIIAFIATSSGVVQLHTVYHIDGYENARRYSTMHGKWLRSQKYTEAVAQYMDNHA